MTNATEAIANELNINYEQAFRVGNYERMDANDTPWLNYGETEVWTDGFEIIVLYYDAASDEWRGEVAGVEFYQALAQNWLERYENSRTVADGFVAWAYEHRAETLSHLVDGLHADVAEGLVGSIRSDVRGCERDALHSACVSILRGNQSEIIAALRESIEEDAGN